jgi:hypothetical protein
VVGLEKRSIGRKGGELAEAAIGEQEIGTMQPDPSAHVSGATRGTCYEGDGVAAQLQGSCGAVLFTRVGRH